MNGKATLKIALLGTLAAGVWLNLAGPGQAERSAAEALAMRAQRAEAELAKLRLELQAKGERATAQPLAFPDPDQAFYATPPALPVNTQDDGQGAAFPVPPPSAATEPSDMEGRRAKLEAHFEAEPVDAVWAGSMEQRLMQAYETLHLEGAQLAMASCRSTLCRIEIGHEDPTSEARLMGSLGKSVELVEGLSQAAYQRLVGAGGEVRTVLFIPREGQSLPVGSL